MATINTKINIEEVPEASLAGLARTVRSGLDGFYSKPENRKKFEAWKRAKEAKEEHKD